MTFFCCYNAAVMSSPSVRVKFPAILLYQQIHLPFNAKLKLASHSLAMEDNDAFARKSADLAAMSKRLGQHSTVSFKKERQGH